MTANDTLPDLKSAKHLSNRVSSTRLVFRVFDSSSFRAYDPALGFLATRPDTAPDETLAEAHLNWGNRTVATPWISTTRRWFWAVWEMNRRFGGTFAGSPTRKRSGTGIRVAVIDLEACRGLKPPVHALEVLGPTSEYRSFADLSDEILVFREIPPAAIVSVWTFEKAIGITGLPTSVSLQMPTGVYLAYRDVHTRFVRSLDRLEEGRTWMGKEGGEKCASIAISMLQDGYRQVQEQLDKMVGPIKATRAWAVKKTPSSDDLMDSLTQGMGALSTVGGGKAYGNVSAPEPSRVSTVEDAFAHMNKGAQVFQKAITRARQDTVRAIQSTNNLSTGYESILDAYTALVTHHKSVHDRLSTSSPTTAFNAFDHLLRLELSCFQAQRKCYEALIVRLARQKIEYLRSIAYEFARTVPLGLVDGLNVDQHDWATAKWSMLGCVDAWLVPLERKLDGLEDRVVPRMVLQAKIGWLAYEQRYPKWWESWGTQLTIDGTEQTRDRCYTYLAEGA